MALPLGTAYIREVFGRYKISAARRKLPFNITIKEFRLMVVQDCHYCGARPQHVRKTKTRVQFPINGIDRLDSRSGYSIRNCVPACRTCNMMKKDLSEREFLAQVESIYEKFVRVFKANGEDQSKG